jgi:hypothetical protein
MPGHVDVIMRQPWDGVPVQAPQRLFARPENGRYRFELLYHPYINDLLRSLGPEGLAGVFAERAAASTGWFFDFGPVPGIVDERYPDEGVGFTGGPYSQYHWELFLHLPLLVAGRCMAEKRFDEAQRWLHFIFDPFDAKRNFWKQPFVAVPGVDEWLRSPYDPHRVARARSGAYQRAVVMRYLDNLLAWGDDLLARDDHAGAALRYRAAAEILGPRPTPAPSQQGEAPTFNQLIAAQGNILVSIENILPGIADNRPVKVGDGIEAVLAPARTLTSFCVPVNDVLLGFWDTVADRLQKVR